MMWMLVTCTLLACVMRGAAQPTPSVALLLWDVDSATLAEVQESYQSANVSAVQVLDITGYTTYQLFSTVCALASSGTAVMVTQAPCQAVLTLSSAADNLGLTLIAEGGDCDVIAVDHVTVTSEVEERVSLSDTVLIRTRTTPYMDEVIYDMLLLLDWKDTIVVHEEDHVIAGYFKNLDSVIDAVNGTSEIFSVSRDTMAADIRAILGYMENSRRHHHVLLVCGVTCITEMLSQANQMDQSGVQQALFTFAVQWLVISEMDSVPMILPVVGEMDHVTVLTPPKQHDVSMTVIENLVNVVNVTLGRIQSMDDWEWASAVTQCGTKLETDRDLTIELKDPIEAVLRPDDSPYMIYAAIWKPGRTHTFELVAEWGTDSAILHDNVFPNIRRGLNAKFLRVGTNTWDPFVMYDANSTTGYKGYCMDLLAMLSEQLNFTYELIEPADGEWGMFTGNRYTGLVGQLDDKEVDIVVAPLGQSIHRSYYIDYSTPFFIETQTVIVQYPDPSKSNWRIYLDPFQWDVWTGILIAIPVAGIILWAFHRLSPYYPREERRKGQGILNDSFWYSFGSFLTQGSDIVPDAQSGRFVVGFWLMYCLVVIASYSGNLVAFFTVSNPSVPFNNLQEMVNSSYKFGTLNGAYTLDHIMSSKGGIFLEIANKMEVFSRTDPEVLSYDHDVHVKKVMDDKYAYIVDLTAAQLLKSSVCSLDTIKEEFIPLKYSIALQNNSAYKEPFDRGLDLFTENGLSKRWRLEWWPQISLCDRGLVTASKPVSLSDMQGAFFLMAIILAMAMICLFIELCIWSQQVRKQTTLRELEQQRKEAEGHREVRFNQYEQHFSTFG